MRVRRIRGIIKNLKNGKFLVLRKVAAHGSLIVLPGTDVTEVGSNDVPASAERPIGILVPLIEDIIGGGLHVRLAADAYVTPLTGMVSDSLGLVPAKATDKNVMSVEDIYFLLTVTEISVDQFRIRSAAEESIKELYWVNKEELIKLVKDTDSYLGMNVLDVLTHFKF